LINSCWESNCGFAETRNEHKDIKPRKPFTYRTQLRKEEKEADGRTLVMTDGTAGRAAAEESELFFAAALLEEEVEEVEEVGAGGMMTLPPMLD
jgi:hypothetical protein